MTAFWQKGYLHKSGMLETEEEQRRRLCLTRAVEDWLSHHFNGSRHILSIVEKEDTTIS